MRQLQKSEAKKFFKKNTPARGYELVMLLENIQYARNVASMFRTADAAGVKKMYLTGITKTPPFGKDLKKASRSKERSVPWKYYEHTGKILNTLKKQGYSIIALEITDSSIPIDQAFRFTNTNNKICVVVGSEVYGVTNKTLQKCDGAMYIPMYGKGASLNVAVSAGIALFTLR